MNEGTDVRPELLVGLHEPYAQWREAALADGWEEIPGGPWGIQVQDRSVDPRTGQLAHTGERRRGDRSIQLVKGQFMVYLMDRYVYDWNDKRKIVGRELETHAWSRNGLRSLRGVDFTYNMEDLYRRDRTCHNCGREVDTLHQVAFANAACNDCVADMRSRLEFPGWAD